LLDDLETLQVGKPDVQDDQIRAFLTSTGQRLLPRGGFQDPIAVPGKRNPEELADRSLVIHHQDPGRVAHASSSLGSQITIVVPPPGVSSARIVPPCAWTNPWQMARPSPVPGGSPGRLNR
jgi:hypothetical protein